MAYLEPYSWSHDSQTALRGGSRAEGISSEVAALAGQLEISAEHRVAVELWIAAAHGEYLDATTMDTICDITRPPRLT